jgi:phosphoribosyl 1,2-cyclic phosphodiesterase
VPVQFTILGSGSSGNCAYLEAGDTRLLIDAGFSGRQIRERLAGIGRSPESLTGIIVTHEHSDHIRGLAVLAGKLGLPVYCNRLTREAIESTVEAKLNFRIFGTGASFDLGEIGIDTFSVPHDAYDPVGFLLHTSAGRIGFLTDLGHATKLILERVRTANVLLLEANHDHQLLTEDTKRPWSVKQRILSRHGHLSNEAAAKVAADVMNPELKHLFLGHLSGDCNRPELALGCVQAQMDAIGANHVRVRVTCQAEAAPTLVLAGAEPLVSPAETAG